MTFSTLTRPLALGLGLAALAGSPVAAQCLDASCPPDNSQFETMTFSDMVEMAAPFPSGTMLSLPQFDPATYAPMHMVDPSAITLAGAQLELEGEITPVIRLDNVNSPTCSIAWTYDVQTAIYMNSDVMNPGLLMVSSEFGNQNMAPGNGAPPPYDVEIMPLPVAASICLPYTMNLEPFIGTGMVTFDADGLAFGTATGCSEIATEFVNTSRLEVRVRYVYCVDDEPPPPVDPGTPYCFGDGSGTACPCGNASMPMAEEGCANSSGLGGKLTGDGSNSVSMDDLTFLAENLIMGQPALLFTGDNATNGGAGVVFGDGLRCAGGNVIRLGVKSPDAMGQATWGPGLIQTLPQFNPSPGETKRMQAWFRDPFLMGCTGAAFNLSNGYEVTYSN